MVEPGLGPVTGGVVPGVGQVFLGIANGLRERTRIEIGEIDGMLGKDCEALRAGFGKSTPDKNAPLFAVGKLHVEKPGPERRQNRRVTRQDGEIALGARYQHLRRIGRDQKPLGRNQFEPERIWHVSPFSRDAAPLRAQATSAASRCAFSIALSMVPTM
jgi:hypothetical protein